MSIQNISAPTKSQSTEAGVMTVGHFRTPFLHFSETFIYGLLDNFSRRVRSIAFTQDPVHANLFPYSRVINYSIRRFSFSWAIDIVARRIFAQHDVLLAAAVKARGVQVMHAHFGEEGYWLLRVKKKLKLPMVTTFYGYDLSELLEQELWRQRYKELFRDGDLFLVEGGHMKKTLVGAGCPEEKVRIQRIAINLDKISFRERKPADEKTIFLFCGRFIEKKGLVYALKACERLMKRGAENFELRVIGDGPLRGEMEEFVKSHGLERHVIFLGRRPHSEFYQLLDDAHIYLAPSVTAANGDTEGGAPTTLLEAQAAGLPALASRHADIPEVMVEGKSGLLSDERDDAGLAENMHFMMTHPEQWPAFGRAGLEHMKAQHDIKREIVRLEEIYAGLIRAYGLEKQETASSAALPVFSDAPPSNGSSTHAPAFPADATLGVQLACPWCGSALSLNGDSEIRCAACSRAAGRIEEGTFIFGEPKKAAEPDTLLTRLADRLRFLEQRQVSGTLYKDIAGTDLDTAYSLLSTFYKGAWRFFTDLSSDKTVLSIESGVGSASFAAAPFVSRMYILHPSADVAKSIAQQVLRRGRTNVHSVSVGSADRLPFPDRHFDTVAIHGLARILGESSHEKLWTDRESLLKEVRRILKPGGSIYIERRSSRSSRRVNPGSALELACLRRTLSRYGLRRKIFLGFSDQGMFPYKVTEFSRIKGPVARLKRFAQMYLGYGRVAVMASGSKEGIKSVWLNRLADDILASPNESLNLHFGSAGIYRVHTRNSIVRIPDDRFAFERCIVNMNALKKLARYELSFGRPYFLTQDELGGQPLFAESRLPLHDVPYLQLNAAQRRDYAAQAVAILSELHQKTREKVSLDEKWFEKIFAGPLAATRSCVDSETAAELEKVENVLRRTALGKSMDLVMVHGDFKITNLLQDKERKLQGLFDWDLSSPLGLPGIDLVIYKGFDRFLEQSHSYPQAIYEAGFESPADPDIRNYRAALGVDDVGCKVQALMSLVHYFLNHIGEEKRKSAAWCRENINHLFVKACGRIAAGAN